MNGGASRDDPVGRKYFAPLQAAETSSDVLFYFIAGLSLISPLVPDSEHPGLHSGLQIAFLVTSLVSVGVGVLIRLYLSPRAEDERRAEFLQNAFGVALTHEKTQGYYNNEQTAPFRRVAAQTMENTLFTKTIACSMARHERLRIAIYAALFLIVVLNRSSNFELIGAVAQAVFSEQLIVRWLRLEWLRVNAERTYSELFNLFSSGANQTVFAAQAVKTFSSYETVKATAQVVLSDRIFNDVNPSLSAEWEKIKSTLRI